MKRRRPQESFKNVRDIRPSRTDRTANGYDKRATTLSVVDAEQKETTTGGFLSPQLFVPTEEQLEKINQFTLRRVSADEVACFMTHSMNDIPDRDDDEFSTKTVQEFATLTPPFSPTGKSFMVSHDTSKLGVGRIFDTGTESFKKPEAMGGGTAKGLTNFVYIPRTVAANKDFIENMEMGINWAVSVGVMIGSASCKVGKEHDWGWYPWWCSEGHEKGYYYDPESDEEDSWGWPMPVSEGAKNAVKTIRSFQGAKDMYELSMVYLGAQYMAAVADKDPAFAGILKSARSIPVIGLRREEARELPMPKVPERLREAAKNHRLSEEDGRFSWVDDDRLVWSFTPGEDTEPLFLGKRQESGMTGAELNAKVQDLKSKLTEAKGELETKDAEAVGALATQLDGLLTAIDDALDSGDLDAANPLVDQAQTLMDQIFDALYEDNEDDEGDENQDPGAWGDNEPGKGANDPNTVKAHSHYHEHADGTGHSHSHTHSGGSYDHGADDLEVTHAHDHDNKSPQGEHMSKKAALAALRGTSLPEAFVQAIEALPDNSPDVAKVLVTRMTKEYETLSVKVTAGEQYMKDLRVEVLDWYRKAKSDPREAKGVDVSHIERLLDKVGDDVETMKSLIADYQAEAKRRFGSSVRRSTIENDPNDPTGDATKNLNEDIESRIDVKRVTRLHG